jgi:hypothetical protein
MGKGDVLSFCNNMRQGGGHHLHVIVVIAYMYMAI